MKICLINPPLQYSLDIGEEWSCTFPIRYRYIDIEYIKAYLFENNCDADVLDCISDNINMDKLKKRLIRNDYDIVLLLMSYYNYINFQRILFYLKTIRPNIFLVVSGDVAELNVEKVLKSDSFIKAVILGDKEKSFFNIIKNLENNVSWEMSNGIAYLDDGRVVHNQEDYFKCLDQMPFPRHKFARKCNTVTIITSKGCYGNCIFCAEKVKSKFCSDIRERSVKNVISEIDTIVKENSPRIISICDANFMPAIPQRRIWLEEFMKELQKRRYEIKFSALLRANDVIYYKDIMGEMKNLGFTSFFVGIESFSQRQLNFYNKKITVSENIRAIQIFKEVGLNINFGFLFLDPFVTIDEISENLQILKLLDICSIITYDQPFFSLNCTVNVIPGTELYSIVVDNDLVMNDNKGYNFVNANVQKYYEKIIKWNRVIKKYDYIRYYVDKDIAIMNGKGYKKLSIVIGKIREVDLSFLIELLSVYENETETNSLINCYEKIISNIIKTL